MPSTDDLDEPFEQELFEASTSLAVLIHGFEGSRRDWRERGGYAKGGDLTERLGRLGRSWIAGDLYGHGDWAAEEPEFSTEHISDELFPSFIARSADAVRHGIEVAAPRTAADHLDVVTYSSGCHVAVRLLAAGELPLPVRTLGLAVPTPERAYDDQYSLHNNLGVFEGKTVGMFVGREDDEVAYDEACWFFDQLPGTAKRRFDYPSGHSLPVEWVDDAVALLLDPAMPGPSTGGGGAR